jgi:O-antigen biosynthesis protein
MTQIRELIKRSMPGFARDAIINARDRLSAPPLEDIVLHDYEPSASADMRPRLSLVIPTIAARSAFGGVTTGLDVFLQIGVRAGAQLRIIVDDFGRTIDRSIVDARSANLGVDPAAIEVVARTEQTPVIDLRCSDIFFTFNWWTTLNIRGLVKRQAELFSAEPAPYIYLVQEYEPQFYAFSSTHMLARLALDQRSPYWGIFNSSQLHEYFKLQGHQVEKAYVFEPVLAAGLRAALQGPPPIKERRILVYGRPTIERNCFPAIEKGLRLWAERHPEFAGWEVVSAGLPHRPMPIAEGRSMRSLGKLSLADYAQMLRQTAVGLSLMSSPHPSYPPLEMAHFGVRTITNRYVMKDLAGAHENIISIDDVAADTLAEALANACRAFEAAPEAGWQGETHMPQFLADGPQQFINDVAGALKAEIWSDER